MPCELTWQEVQQGGEYVVLGLVPQGGKEKACGGVIPRLPCLYGTAGLPGEAGSRLLPFEPYTSIICRKQHALQVTAPFPSEDPAEYL